jgi:hypothetical protein
MTLDVRRVLADADALLTREQRERIALAWARRNVGKFDPNQPRDEQGRWSDGGGGDGGAAPAPSGGKEPEDMRLVGSGVDRQRVENWRKDLEEKLDALEKQGKAGEEEWDKINRMEIALGFFLNASEKDKAAGHASLMEVHDGNNKLLATVFTQHNPETRVSTIEGIGGLEKAALTKALEHTVLHEQSGNHAERIEKVEFADNADIIAAMEAAGFQKQTMQDPSVVRMVIGPEKTEAEKAKEERETAEHAARIGGASRAAARLLGYDPKLVAINTGDHPFKIGGETMQRYAAGIAHLETGVISIFPKHIYSEDGAVSVMAHEVAHQKFQTVLNAVNAEYAKMRERERAGEVLTKPDGTLYPQYVDQYPLVARFEQHNDYKTIDKRRDTDGITDYSKAYWKQAGDDVDVLQRVSERSATHETLAEMAKRLTETGKLEGAPVWRSYYRDIMKTYDELKAKK